MTDNPSHTAAVSTNAASAPAYVIAGLSFIPLIGLAFGIAAIAFGVGTRERGGKRIAAIGTAGIMFNFLLYGSLFYFGLMYRGGVYGALRANAAQSTINALVPAIEFYKLQNGMYPDSLQELQESQPKDNVIIIFDPTVVDLTGQPRYFFYERVGSDHYYLRGVGADDKPFTADDIVPRLPQTSSGKIGLLLSRTAS